MITDIVELTVGIEETPPEIVSQRHTAVETQAQAAVEGLIADGSDTHIAIEPLIPLFVGDVRIPADHFLSSAIEENLAAVVFRAHRKVNPIGSAAFLLDEFIKHPMVFVSGVEQQTRIPDHLLRAITPDIHRTTRQVIRALRPSALPIHLLRAVSAGNYDGDFPS